MEEVQSAQSLQIPQGWDCTSGEEAVDSGIRFSSFFKQIIHSFAAIELKDLSLPAKSHNFASAILTPLA